jgi:hypothetical protein
MINLRSRIVEILPYVIPMGVVAIWIVLQIWVLPRLGVPT